ncbi:MAG: hypothetical protein HXS54_16220 [Theionarchaea archaeon]|nr:hypothetical protein [Theionarchaea archaeon]
MIDFSIGLSVFFGVATVVALYISIKSYIYSKATVHQLRHFEETISLFQDIEALKTQKCELDEEIKKKEYAILIAELIRIEEVITRNQEERDRILSKLPLNYRSISPSVMRTKNSSTTS